MDILATIKDLEDMIASGKTSMEELPAAIGLLAGLRAGYICGREDAAKDAGGWFIVEQIRAQTQDQQAPDD